MKKILLFTLVLTLISAVSFAQQASGNIRRHAVRQGHHKGDFTRPERSELRKDVVKYKIAKHHARKDGKVTPRERKRLHIMRKHTRHDAFRFKHNRHRRHI